MRTTIESLAVRIVVRRVNSGSTPFCWEIHRDECPAAAIVSSNCFKSMEAAHKAGHARLAELSLVKQRTPKMQEA